MAMIKFLSFCTFLCFACTAAAQNLVANPSFEDTVNCTTGFIYESVGWASFTESPDYFNSCADDSTGYNVPNTALGYQQAYDGNAFAGIIFCTSSLGPPPIRECFGTQLTEMLIIGQKYYASFYASLPDNFPWNCWSNKLGAKFTTFSHSAPEGDTLLMTNSAQIYSDSLLKDTANWVQIKGSFIADSAYQYIVIGNFFNDINTDTLNCSGAYSYAFIDMVCVSTDSLLCSIPTLISLQKKMSEIKIYPNPSSTIINIDFPDATKPYDLIIYNSFGQVVFNKKEYSIPNATIDISNISNGVLMIKISNDTQSFNYKLLKQ